MSMSMRAKMVRSKYEPRPFSARGSVRVAIVHCMQLFDNNKYQWHAACPASSSTLSFMGVHEEIIG